MIIIYHHFKNKLCQAMESRYCIVIQNGRDHREKWNEPSPTTPKVGLQPKKVMCICWNWKGILYYELLPENQMIDSSKYCSQLEQLKVVLSGNHPSVNRKCIIFNQDNAKTTCLFDDQAKTVTAWVGSSDSSTICTRHCTYFGLYKILLMENISIPWKTVKGIWNSFLPQKVQSFQEMKLWSCLKSGRR